MRPTLSVIICTHNPRKAYLERVLEALRKQSLSVSGWELIVVDNACTNGTIESIDLSWHPRGRVVKEPELGLTPARLRGIAESSGEVLVYVDDDNVLDPEYLECAVAIASEWPMLGTWGAARITPEFERAPAVDLEKQTAMLALFERDSDIWSNNADDSSSYPSGAGLCVRRIVAEAYRVDCGQKSLNRYLDRRGNHLLSGGDTLIVQTATKVGMGWGAFLRLTLLHLIPRARVELAYLLELREKMTASQSIVRYLRSGACDGPDTRWTGRAKYLYHFVKLAASGQFTDWRFHRANMRGHRLARKIIRGWGKAP
jgi:glycosyltransferase involved in cell wall biosynthesis